MRDHAAGPMEPLMPLLTAVNAEVRRAQAAWPGLTFARDRDSIYGAYPALFGSAFPAVSDEFIRRFAVAAKFLATSIVVLDHQLDRSRVSSGGFAQTMLTVQAMQLESSLRFAELFPGESPFWDCLRRRLAEFTRALFDEDDFARDRRSMADYDDTVGRTILVAKTGVARIVVDGLGIAAQDDGPVAALNESIEAYSIARQMIDDLLDWRLDLRERVPSMLLGRVIDTWPAFESDRDFDECAAQIGRRVYYGGAAVAALDIASSELKRFDDLVSSYDLPVWCGAARMLRGCVDGFHAQLAELTDANRARLAAARRFTPRPFAETTPEARLAGEAMRYLLVQSRRGWLEARHFAVLDPGNGEPSRVIEGDVFQRAIAADALQEIDATFHPGLEELIDDEITYLLGQRNTDGVQAWTYFRDFAELAPDADDLAAIMQVFLRRGRRDIVERTCEMALSTVLGELVNADGSIRTWIVPEHGRSACQQIQADYVELSLGTAGAPDVVANLVHALELYDHARFAEPLARARAYLQRAQTELGSWESAWYVGPFYGTYVAMRALGAAPEPSESVARGAHFVIAAQRSDGGWGTDGRKSDALATALALLALHYGAGAGEFTAAVAAGLQYLEQSGNSRVGWPNVPFIRQRLATLRANGEPEPAPYGSRTVTSAYVAKAAAVAARTLASRSREATVA